ncbi:MAG TPA: ECF-type sigma factor [Dokdonella sp.]|uniref:ECF-type sigma factor n=1 Tax=Dokdonella sp. TaxID=2291710 RepID=UPI002BF6717D|nr:ECF-type sigma factor [Dokdonella sp.]HUD41918.1 ECF-type sigma factor [Dokdonella sp.]
MTADDTTALIQRWQNGDAAAFDQLLSLIYADLRAIARRQLRGERATTLQPTALVNDVLLRMIERGAAPISDGTHFFKVAARAMRHFLVDRARRASTEKHGGQLERLELLEVMELPMSADTDVQRLDAALVDLEAIEPALARIVELRYFVGLTVREVAGVLGVDESTVYRDWALARVWLRDHLAT